jgi:hypothetical protein
MQRELTLGLALTTTRSASATACTDRATRRGALRAVPTDFCATGALKVCIVSIRAQQGDVMVPEGLEDDKPHFSFKRHPLNNAADV